MAKRFIDSPQILDSTNEDLIPETPPESPYKNLGSKTPMTWRQRKLNNSDKVIPIIVIQLLYFGQFSIQFFEFNFVS